MAKKLFSTDTKQFYDTDEELEQAEKEFAEKKANEEKALTIKKDEAKEVEDAYKAYMEAKKKAYEDINSAEKLYLDKRNEFIKKYGSFHMTYKDSNAKPFVLDDWFSDLYSIFDHFLLK